jgi:hypothetical protein
LPIYHLAALLAHHHFGELCVVMIACSIQDNSDTCMSVQAQLTLAYPQLKFESVRGNLNTRLAKLEASTDDGAAGSRLLRRLEHCVFACSSACSGTLRLCLLRLALND